MSFRKHWWWQQLIAIALLLGQPALFFRGVIANVAHIPYDIEGFHLPLASFLARCAREHILPFWDPYSYCGTAFWADIQAQVFYPITWAALLISNLSGSTRLFYWLEILVPLHMVMAGLFTYFFMRSLSCSVPIALLGATTFQLGAFFSSQTQHLGAVCGAAWFPFILLGVVRMARHVSYRWIGLTAVGVALNILTGFPAGSAVALISAAMLACALVIFGIARWRFLVPVLSGIALGICMCAVQLIPTAQASQLSVAKLRGDRAFDGGGLPIRSLVSFVSPNFYHIFNFRRYALPYNPTALYTYCGHLPAMLVFLAPLLLLVRRYKQHQLRLLLLSLALAVLSAIWMIGQATPLYPLVFRSLPQIVRGSLYAEDALIAFTFWIAVTAGLTLKTLNLKWPVAAAWLVALLTAINLVAVSSRRPLNELHGGYQTRNSESILDGKASTVELFQQLSRTATPPLRIDFFDPAFWPLNTGAEMYRIPSAIGDNPFVNLRYFYFRLGFSGSPYTDREQSLKSAKSRWIDAIDDGVLIAMEGHNPPTLPSDRFEDANVTGLGLRVWKNKAVLPRFYLVDHIRRASTTEEARAALVTNINPSDEAVVENLRPDWVGSGSVGSSVQVLNYTNNHLELLVHTTGPSFLVSSEAFYPGWKADINGRPADLLPTNIAFRGLPVPAGDSYVTMTFRPDYLVPSIALSVMGLTVCAILVLSRPRQNLLDLSSREPFWPV